MEKRITIYTAPPLEAALNALGAGYRESRSGRIATIAERYMAMVADELDRLDLTRAEWLAILDANNGVAIYVGDSLPASMIWANVADTRGLGAKWGVDQDALVKRLRALPRSTLIAIVEACDRFWSRSTEPTEQALAAAGIKPKEETT
jgi:hypothetical protein